jgi:hypothetical protein
MTAGTDMHDPDTLMATANQFAEMMETATRLIEALAPAMGRFGRFYAALDQLSGSIQDGPAARIWTLPAQGTIPAHEQPAMTTYMPLGGAANADDGSLRTALARSGASGPDSVTLVILFVGGSQTVDLEQVYQTLAEVPGVEEVIPGAYSRDRAAFDLRTSRPAHELELQQALVSAIPEATSGEWTASGEFLVVIGGPAAQPEHAAGACDSDDGWRTPAASGAELN